MTQSALTTPFRIRDAIPLPPASRPLAGRAARADEYPVHVVGAFDEAVEQLADLAAGRAVAIVTDETVESLYGATVIAALRDSGAQPVAFALPAGEETKSLDQAATLWDWLAGSELGRRDLVVALGGGVIADLAGWVASAYMRGVPYVNVPTTLMAQVDGALGGKVAVNHPTAKNLLGAFHQPVAVLSSVDVLTTLDDRHVRAGLAEVVKKAMIASPALWALLDEHAERLLTRDPRSVEQLVRGAVAVKLALIERDPYEADLRRPLNFGHTIGHPLETVTGYQPLLHGEAVALGMVVESRIALRRGFMEQSAFDGLVELLRRFGLPTTASALPAAVDGEAVVEAMAKVRQIRAGSLRYVLPVAIGETVIADDVTQEELRCALDESGFRLVDK